MTITHSELLKMVSYNPDTGEFTWLIKPRNRECSPIAGTIDPYGYRKICLKQKIYRAHRLAWFYMHMAWPEGAIDHINGKRDDNRIGNLRIANHSQNQANSKVRANNKTGFKGIYLHKLSGLYMARVTVNRKSILVGYYKDPQEAHAAYIEAAKKYFGDFARSK